MNKTRFGLPAFKNLDACLISLIGLIMILIYTRHGGIGISPDSIAYLSVARNIIMHGSPVDYTLSPLVDFPVCYPFFLSIVGFVSGQDPLVIAPWLNGLLFAGLIVLLGSLINSFEGVTRSYKWIILICIALSPSLLEIYSMLWSETLFILFTIVFISAFGRYLRKRSVISLLCCALIASAACITRYAGVTIIGAGLMLLVFDRSLEWKKKLRHCLWFGLGSISLLLINLLRNRLITGSLTGPREPGILTLSDNLIFTGRVICNWLPVSGQQSELVSGVAILVLIVISLLFLKRSWSGIVTLSTENCFAAFFIVYTVFITGISTISHFEQINNRLLSPLYIPMVISLTSWVPRVIRRLPVLTMRLAGALAILIASGFAVYQYEQVSIMYDEVKGSGIPGYTEDAWKNSETAGFLRKRADYFDPAYEVYSNAHEAAYFNGGLITESLPQRRDKRDTFELLNGDAFYLIWFDDFSDNELVKFRTIRQHADLIKKYDFKDGDIFFVRPRHSSAQQR
ncbi:hypothetical protein [Pedobacter hartonius]|nr:hypothetical protein [Pedobacter hartonius]